MRKIFFYSLMMIVLLMITGVLSNAIVYAGSKDMDGGKRIKFEDDNFESMKEVLSRREEKEDEFRIKMIESEERTIELLTEIRDYLKQLNEQ